MSITYATTLFNEESNVPRLREFYTNLGLEAQGTQFLFIDNNSSDGTHQKLQKEFKNLQNVKIVSNTISKGYGDGFRRIIQETETPFVLIYPGDFQFTAIEISRFVSTWRLECQGSQHVGYFSVRRRLDGIYAATRGRMWRLLLCAAFRIPFKFDPASQLRILCIDCIPKTSSFDFTVDIEVLKKILSQPKLCKTLSSKVNFTSRLDGKSSIEKGFLLTEFKVVIAAINLRKIVRRNGDFD